MNIRYTRRLTLLLAVALLSWQALPLRAQQLALPVKSGSVRFAAIGDMGTGDPPQYEVAQRMLEFNKLFPFTFVIMLGDNIYGGKSPAQLKSKFETPYKSLLDAGVLFYAALGNHDDTNERFYKFFNMNGQSYYTFKKGNVQFFALDSNYLDPKELAWIEKELAGSRADWKICYFHHPLYSSGRAHGSSTELRTVLEPLFLKYGVQVVFSGHDHVYERVRPQKGIYYFTEGASGELRAGDLKKTDLTAAGYDKDRSFLSVEISGDDLYFQTLSRTGVTVDSGTIRRPVEFQPARAASPGP
jgi:predicted MPP superfamily phosphohydrolase